MSVKLTIKHCGECPAHQIVRDPDPDDWFNDDDEKVICTKAGKDIVTMCRPYQTQQDLKDVGVPRWCPLRKK